MPAWWKEFDKSFEGLVENDGKLGPQRTVLEISRTGVDEQVGFGDIQGWRFR